MVTLLPTPGLAQWAKPLPQGLVFFVGNSFTRQHDVPGLVCWIAQQSGVQTHCHRQTADGAKLLESIDVPARLAQDWNGRVPARVVLQDHSTVPLSEPSRQGSARAMATWDRHFQGTVLFQTWPRRAGHPLYQKPGMPAGPDQMAAQTHAHYVKQAKALDATLAPVAPAWMQATGDGIDLYARDGYHANLSGAWLCAMLLARALGLPVTPDTVPPKSVMPDTHVALARIAAT